MIVLLGMVILIIANIILSAWLHARLDEYTAGSYTEFAIMSSFLVVIAMILLGPSKALLVILNAIIITALIRGAIIGSFFLYDYCYKKFKP